MTIIFWDGETLWADRMASSSSFVYETTKIGRLNYGNFLYGLAGGEHANKVLHWLNKKDRKNEDFPQPVVADGDTDEGEVLVVCGTTKTIRVFNKSAFPDLIENEYWAIGAGADVARGLAYEIYKRTNRKTNWGFDVVSKTISILPSSCGLGIDSIRFGDKKPTQVVTTTVNFKQRPTT